MPQYNKGRAWIAITYATTSLLMASDHKQYSYVSMFSIQILVKFEDNSQRPPSMDIGVFHLLVHICKLLMHIIFRHTKMQAEVVHA
jgi:hypothetical protein